MDKLKCPNCGKSYGITTRAKDHTAYCRLCDTRAKKKEFEVKDEDKD